MGKDRQLHLGTKGDLMGKVKESMHVNVEPVNEEDYLIGQVLKEQEIMDRDLRTRENYSFLCKGILIGAGFAYTVFLIAGKI